MNRINLFRSTPSTLNSVSWGKKNFDNTSTLIFAALLIVCSVAVGCSSDKPKPVSSEAPVAQSVPPVTTSSTPIPAVPVQQAAAKPVHKKIVHKAPPTLTYADKTSGVSFQYPRKYALKTGDAATELVSSGPIPMDFVQPGGVALAAVSLPESTYPNSDLASAFFNVSVNKTLTADQCGEFSVPQPNPAAPADPTVEATAQLATPPISKLMIGDMELQSSETTTSGPREEASKYYHVFQNGACYEFALKVATTESNPSPTTQSTTKPVNRDEVLRRLEKILATVKINPITAPEVNAEVKTNTQPSETPAQ
ncbi:MAG TPA: hypothetical protein VJX47_05325 [Candidatus Sulfotelmatobacter sp.]|nr:hypothetical protein [Candidatus Sulfotelmatobacter sp.]